MGMMQLMDLSGDKTVIKWNPENEVEVRMARETFDRYVREHFSMFVMDEDEEQGRRLREFDPTVAGIIAVPQLRGG